MRPPSSVRGAAATLVVLISCGLAVGAAAVRPELPRPHIKVVETQPMRIDKIFTSMAGPSDRVDMDLTDIDWVTAFKSEVVDAGSGAPMADEFFCHSQIQLPNSTRLMVTATGSSEIRFPAGFGMPVKRILAGLPSEQRHLSLLGMVLNNHDPDMNRLVKVRGTVEYYKDKELGAPPLLKKLFKSNLTLVVDDMPGADPAAATPKDGDGVSTHCATVGGLRSHWFVPPGPQVTRKRHRGFLPVNARVHYAVVHLHNYGRYFLLRDRTTDKVLWRTDVVYEPNRVQIAKIPVYSSSQGFEMDARHEYEIEAGYDNTTDKPVDAMAQVDLYYRPDGDVDISYPKGPQ